MPAHTRTTRSASCSALVVGGEVYLVDFGDGAGRRLKQAALVDPELRSPGGLWGEETLRAMFVTHLHSDHVAAYFNFFMLGWYNGITAARAGQPVHVFGPGRRVDEDGNVVMEPILTVPGLPVSRWARRRAVSLMVPSPPPAISRSGARAMAASRVADSWVGSATPMLASSVNPAAFNS